MLLSDCPWQNCKHRFIVRWSVEFTENMPLKLLVPPFKKMNGIMFEMIREHMKEHSK